MQDANGAWLDHEAVSYSLATAYTPNMMMPTPTLSHPDIMLELERAETRSFSTILAPMNSFSDGFRPTLLAT